MGLPNQHNGGGILDEPDVVLRCVTVRGNYGDEEGEAFLNWRKGECFATYNFGVRLEFQGSVRVAGRTIGQSKGVAWFHDVKYDDDDAADGARPFATLQGAWELPAQGQQYEPGNKGAPQRAPVPYEERLKAVVAERGIVEVRQPGRETRAGAKIPRGALAPGA